MTLDADFAHHMSLVFSSEYHDPHRILGLHDAYDGKRVIRLFRPGAEEVYLEVFGKTVSAVRLDDAGLFEYLVPGNTTLRDYRVYHQSGLLGHDPYAFSPTIGELDHYLFAKGTHYQIFKVMGSPSGHPSGCSRHPFCCLGPCRQKSRARRRFQFLGWPHQSHAQHGSKWNLGTFRSRFDRGRKI